MKKSHQKLLFLSIVIVAGYTWSLDMPQALQVPLRKDPYNFNNFQFNFIYVATYGAIFFSDMPLGMLLDKFPLKRTILIIAGISLLSEIMIMLMFHFSVPGYLYLIYIFRGIFGITGEGLFTIQALLISRYGGAYYDMLMGVGLCLPFLLDAISNFVTPVIYSATKSMQFVWCIGIGFCLLALLSSLYIVFLVQNDQKQMENEKIQKLQKLQKNKVNIMSIPNDNNLQNTQFNQFNQEDYTQQVQKQQEPLSQQINFNGLKSMCKQFWVVIAAIFFTQYGIASYVDNLNDSIVKRFQISYVTAGYLAFIPYGVAAGLSYFLGKILEDNPLFRRKSIFFSSLFFSMTIAIVYVLKNIQQQQVVPTLYYFIIGIQFTTVSFSLAILYTCLSSSIKYLVEPQHLGIAWGVIGSTIGLSEAVGPLIASFLLQTGQNLADGYKNLTLYILCTSFVGLGFTSWILFGSFQKIDTNAAESQQKANNNNNSNSNKNTNKQQNDYNILHDQID